MPRYLAYLAAGCLIALAIVVGFYSKLAAFFCLLLAYTVYRMGRHGLSEIEPLFQNANLGGGEMELVQESENELTVRGSNMVLILNRRDRAISNLYSTITTYDKVRHIRISKQSRSGEYPNPGQYSVTLSLGTFSSICLGHTNSEIDASTVAAKLSTWIGKGVITA